MEVIDDLEGSQSLPAGRLQGKSMSMYALDNSEDEEDEELEEEEAESQPETGKQGEGERSKKTASSREEVSLEGELLTQAP